MPSHQLADVISSILNVSFKEKWEILNAVDVSERFKKALPLLLRQIEGQKMLQKKSDKESSGGGQMAEYFQKKPKSRQAMLDDDHDIDEIEDLEIKLR